MFAGYPPAGLLAAYDQKCGFNSSRDAVTERRREDARAMAVLDAKVSHLMFPDGQYGSDRNEQDIIDACSAILNDEGVDQIFFPLGISHPDHETCSRCVLGAVASSTANLYVYEDLPSRVLYPHDVPPRLDHVRSLGWDLELVTMATGPEWVKEAAVACYRSQLVSLDGAERICTVVPERVWRVTRQKS